MRLYLVQHGDAIPERVDPERPLSAEGRRDVEAVARLLASAGTRAVRVAHSGKLRRNRPPRFWRPPWHLPRCRRS
jgi:phosphohistidine phosphatase